MSATASCFTKTPLESWIARRLAVSELSLTCETIARHQLRALRETVAWVRNHSSFYSQRLAALPDGFPNSLDEVSRLPLTSAEDLVQHMPGLLCVSQEEITRVVTLQSSGTSGAPKRILFTAVDQGLALDFFANGIATMAQPGDRMLITLPGEREGSVGYQLARGIARAGVIPIPHGLSVDPAGTLAHMEREKATCIIGLPVQMLALTVNDSVLADSALRRLRSIVLCSDHVPQSLVHTLRRRTGAEIFEHYGMTEMGLGGGVDCEAHMGYHLREADLYFEIVNSATGEPLPDGEMGEVIFTTLNRKGMPLIRYRTGDISCFVREKCGCGTILKRLARVRGRIDGSIRLGTAGSFNISMLDEALFAVPRLIDFAATLDQGPVPCLRLVIYAPGIDGSRLVPLVRRALTAVPGLSQSCVRGELQLAVDIADGPIPVNGAKRKIEVRADR